MIREQLERFRWTTKFINLIIKLDSLNLRVLKVIPPKIKQKLVTKALKFTESTVQQQLLEFDGYQFFAPGPIRNQIYLIESNHNLQNLLASAAHSGMTAIDVGANHGYHALSIACKVGNAGKVYAVEPAPDNVSMLNKNIQLNNFRNIMVIPHAVGDKNEVKSFYLRKNYHDGTGSLFPDHHSTVEDTMQVKVARLDDVIEGPVDLVKIDVEGAEINVLLGMPRILLNPTIKLFVEWNPPLQKAAGYDPDQLPLFLLEQGFRVFVIDWKNHELTSKNDVQLALEKLSHKSEYVDLYSTRQNSI